LSEITEDPLKSYYGPGNEHILRSIKTNIKTFLDSVKLDSMSDSKEALAMAFTYEACELYPEARELYGYICSKMDQKEKLASEGEKRVSLKLNAQKGLPL